MYKLNYMLKANKRKKLKNKYKNKKKINEG